MHSRNFAHLGEVTSRGELSRRRPGSRKKEVRREVGETRVEANSQERDSQEGPRSVASHGGIFPECIGFSEELGGTISPRDGFSHGVYRCVLCRKTSGVSWEDRRRSRIESRRVASNPEQPSHQRLYTSLGRGRGTWRRARVTRVDVYARSIEPRASSYVGHEVSENR